MKNLIEIPIEKIEANPFQPRQEFEQEALQELAESIKEYGVLQPLLVAPKGTGYILLAGERRLRASKLAGLTHVPCVVGEYDDKQKAEIALIENLQRQDLHFFEEATAIQTLLQEFNVTQEELAQHLGKSQSAIANKLRLLKLDEKLQQDLIKANLTERHARALLKLEETERPKVLRKIISGNLNVGQTEKYIEKLHVPRKATHRLIVANDLRIYLNSFKKVVDIMNKGGIKTEYKYMIENDDVLVTIKFPNKKSR